MENSVLIYILKVNLAIAAIYLLYHLLLRRDTFVNLHRGYLLGGILFAFVYPLIQVGDWLKAPVEIPTIMAQSTISGADVTQTIGDTNLINAIDYKPLIIIGLIVVSSIFIVKLLVNLLSIYRLGRQVKEVKPVDVLCLEREIVPFSFFRWTFINENLHSAHELDEILLHEQMHIRGRHSVDVMLSEVLCALCWYNPFTWLLRKEIKTNLEYLADRGVLKHGLDRKSYQYHLLKITNFETVQLTNNFNVSQLKKRITMMNKEKTTKKMLLKYALVLPLILVMLGVNKMSAENNNREKASVPTQNDLTQTRMSPPVIEHNEASAPTQNDLTQTPPPPAKNSHPLIQNEKTGVYDYLPDMPKYTGGVEALYKFFYDNLKFPETAAKNNVHGRVVVGFVVQKDGSITDVKIVKSLEALCDAEAVRVIKLMPKWIPGKMNDKPVSVQFKLPIAFTLATPSK